MTDFYYGPRFSNNADSTLAEGISTGATSFSVASGDRSKFPYTTGDRDWFYLRLGTSDNNEVVLCWGDDTSETINCLETAHSWALGTVVKLTDCAELLSDLRSMALLDYKSNAVTYSIKSSGGHFTTLSDAITAIKEQPFSHFILRIGDGAILDCSIAFGDNDPVLELDIVADISPFSAYISGVSSSSGTSGNYSIVLSVSDTSGFSVDQFVSIRSASGGTYPEFLLGIHQITNIVTNTSITLNIKSSSSNIASGSVTCTAMLVPFFIGSYNEVLSITNGSKISLNDGIYALNQHSTNAIKNRSQLILLNSGVMSINYPDLGGSLLNIDGGELSAANSLFCGTNYTYGGLGITGLTCTNQGSANLSNCALIDLTIGIIAQRLGHIKLEDSSIQNCTTGLKSDRLGLISISGCTLTSNTTDYSPAINTLGTMGGLIENGS